jgi:L-ascorbate metabolism protein UlaG (beta-lactamase superfamily)
LKQLWSSAAGNRCAEDADVAFLPVNGAITQFPNMTPRDIPADLMRDQAASAVILEARVACPIHYGAFHNPPVYVELPDVERTFLAASDRLGVVQKIVAPGNEVAIR